MPMPQLSRWILLALIAPFAGHFVVQTIANVPPPPAQLTAEQDHQRILDLLHITSLRRGPDGDPKSPNAANFDETKVATRINLPDPLLLKSGTGQLF
jgi:hypothetical protein